MPTKPFYKVEKGKGKGKYTLHTIPHLMVFTHAFYHTSIWNLLKWPDTVTYRNQLEVLLKKYFLPSWCGISCEGFLWIQQRNWQHWKDLPYNINLFYISIT